MKNSLIVFRSNPVNIGDWIQCLAASKFFPQIDTHIERENVSQYDGEYTKAIMNAWWMWTDNWPPSEKIKPLYVSVHISPEASKWMLNDKGIKYLKKYEPIGCRDWNTLKMLKSNGIDAYFSGCLTLTLGKWGGYLSKDRTDEIFICDPYYNITTKSLLWGRCNLLSLMYVLAKHSKFFKKIYSSFGYKHKMFNIRNKKIKKVFKYFQLAYFYRVYTSLFSKELIENAVYTTQWIDLKDGDVSSKLSAENKSFEDELLLSMADKLIRRYAKAKMVITSRIHCGLPSLGCETPVLFVTSEELQSQSKTKVGGRLEGLSDLFHLVTYKKNNTITLTSELQCKDKLTSKFCFTNKDIFKKYRDSLIQRCCDFVKV